MVENYSELFSERSKGLKASEIRELLKMGNIPGLISFGGGLPNPEAFPIEVIKKCIDNVFKGNIIGALQYGTTEGLPQLRKEIVARMGKKGIQCTEDDMMITSGSQQALSFVGYTFLDCGDFYVAGVPSYLGAIQSFHAYRGKCAQVQVTDEGFNMDGLKSKLEELKALGIKPKFIYVVSSCHNPSGQTMSLAQRKEIIKVAEEYDTIIVEDDPYSEITFEGEPLPPIKSFDKGGRVIYLGTFSKVLAPGFRIGWIIAPKKILDRFVMLKQSTDLCTNVFAQHVAYEYLRGGYIDEQIKSIRKLYKRKRDIMVQEMQKNFPKGVTWTVPKGGMFLWVTLPEGTDTRRMFAHSIEKKVAYVIGDAFYPDGDDTRSMRINFTYSSDEEIIEGIKRLSEIIKDEMKRSSEGKK
ncbi:MAG: PLP-dependent aminotransferase family protein [Candidatus Thermoplasmatota archaeon]|nr:PLP-dependent aminotransferase family protein [Candidatus Thermoplasmatota archaeon]